LELPEDGGPLSAYIPIDIRWETGGPSCGGSVLVLSLTLAATAATAQEHPWVARVQAGSTSIHEWGTSGAKAQVGRSFVGGVLSADLAVSAGRMNLYASLTAGLEVLPFGRPPFAREMGAGRPGVFRLRGRHAAAHPTTGSAEAAPPGHPRDVAARWSTTGAAAPW
jgi:hypothetical protein